MQKVLIPVDGSKHSDNATRYVVEFTKQHGPVEVHIVNAEPAPIAWQTHGMEESVIQAHLTALGRSSLQTAEHILNEAGISYHPHLGQGEIAQFIVQLAAELECDTIVMGSRGLGSISGLALGSVTRKVLHLSDLPVVCVK